MTVTVSRLLLGLMVAGALCASGLSACSDPPIKNITPPAGIMRGQILYTGPPPCTEKGHIVGSAVILIFDQKLLPPPEGLAARSERVKVVPGDLLFAEASKTLEYAADGRRVCAPAGSKAIFASAPWDISPLVLGNYQVRAFYDLDGDFHPAFRFSNLPTKGDITGGAIGNIVEALQGRPPQFTSFRVGVPNARGELEMPATGIMVDNISVAVALPSAAQRPYFHVSKYWAGSPTKLADPGAFDPEQAATFPATGEFPARVVIPADHHLVTSDPFTAQPYLWTLRLEAGLPAAERDVAQASPFFMRLDTAAGAKPIATLRWDSNKNGILGDEGDRVVGSETNAPALAPIISLQKLDPTDPIRRTAQASPRVINSAVTIEQGRLSSLLSRSDPKEIVPVDHLYAAIRPTAVCIPDPTDRNGTTLIVTPYKDGLDGQPIIPKEALIKGDVAATLNRNVESFKIIYGCLPPGEFTVNLINVSGQAWTLPNESGVCMPGEANNGSTCGGRERLASQDTVVVFGKPNDVSYCNQIKGTPEGNDFRAYCLSPAEQIKFDRDELWNLP